MCEWFNEEGYRVDVDALAETFGFEFTTLGAYLPGHGWEEKERMAATSGWVKTL